MMDSFEQFSESVKSDLFDATKLVSDESSVLKVIALANSEHRILLDNWILAMKRAKVEDYVVVAMDLELYESLSKNDVPTILLKYDKDSDCLWEFRLHFFRYLLDQGIGFIHSDLDAVWLRNPIPDYLSKYEDCDLLISQGLAHPARVFNEIGFVLCCGLFRLMPTDSARTLLRMIAQDIKKTHDDQNSLNFIVERLKLNWRINDPYEYEFGDKKLCCSKDVMIGESSHIKIGVLPFELFPRVFSKNEEAYVVHPFTHKDPVFRRFEMMDEGLWFIPKVGESSDDANA